MLLQCLVDLFVVATYLLLQYLFELANDDLKLFVFSKCTRAGDWCFDRFVSFQLYYLDPCGKF